MSTIAQRPKRKPLNIRVPYDKLAEIDRQAQARGLSRTAFVIKASLGELDTDPADERFSDLELRLSRLERQLGL